MHKKINVDYFKNKLDKLPPVQLPRIKSRKIFSAKSSPSDNDVPPPLPKVPPPTIVDRSPVTLSTISALVEGAPKYDYSFGGAEVPEEVIERHLKEDTKKQHTLEGSGSKSTTRGFSEKLTKHYKEFSEFKFKNILGRKTIVRTTEIQVDMYKQRYEEDLEDRESSDKSDYDDFDVHSLPSGADRRASSDSSILPTRQSVPNITVTENEENLQNIDDIEPIESTLYRIKKRSESMEINESTTTDKDITTNNSKPSHRQAFDNACDKAKKAVNLKFQKLLQLKSKSSQDSVPTAPLERKPATYRKQPPVKQESVESCRESLNSSMEASVDYNLPKHDWTSKRILSSDSIETPRCLKTRYYRNDDNDDDDDYVNNDDDDNNNVETRAVIIAHRPAPPIPKPPRNEWGVAANNEIITAFHKVTPPSSIQKRNFLSDLMKGHTRKPSMDSVDSDSWIPDTYRNNRSPIELNKIDENAEPWSKKKSTTTTDGLKKLRKIQSIDIFTTGDECEHVFEDFDDALRNVPVIPIVNQTTSSDLSVVKRERPSRPLVQQAALARRFSDDIEAENLENIDVNKLISQFEPNIVYNNKTEKIKVTAVVETTTTTTKIDHSPVKDIAINSTVIYEEDLSNSPSPCSETFRSNTIKRKPISAKEWALRAKAVRSLEPGAQGSDDIFYSFDSGNYAYKPPSPRKKVIRRKVYRIDL